MKLRTKLFITLIAVQTVSMAMFLIFAFYKIYAQHLIDNSKYSQHVFYTIEKDIAPLLENKQEDQTNAYLRQLKSNLELARSSIIHYITIKDDEGNVVASKSFSPLSFEIHGVIPAIVKLILGDYYKTDYFHVIRNRQALGQVEITISNQTLIESTISLVRIIMLIWFSLVVVVTFIYYVVLVNLTKNISALNIIIDNLENENYEMDNIKLSYRSDEISQLVNSIKHITSDIVKQTKINRKLNLQKSILLANISNNMLTPLNAISGAVDLLKFNHINQEDYRTIRFIETSSTVLLHQITNILTYMELKESDAKLKTSTCMMSDLVYSAFKTAKTSLDDDKDVKISFDDSNDLKIYVKADIEKLETVFTNVIENAIDFTKSGSVNIHVSSVHVDNKNMRYQICVEDTGMGIEESRLEKIKNSLDNVDDENIQTQVSGLGLVISNLILRKMNGGLTLHSIEGHGTTAIIELIAEKSSISRVL